MLRVIEPNKILICGDIHTKYDIIEKVASVIDNYDLVVFTGDYVDEWDAMPESSLNCLNRLLELREQTNKVVLLYGNHDLSEWKPEYFKCSGFNAITHTYVKDFFDKNHDKFLLTYAIRNVLLSHAGLTSQWYKDNIKKFDELAVGFAQDTPAKKYSYKLNFLFNQAIDNNDEDNFLSALATAGPARGGWHAPSPIWADDSELIRNPIPFIDQIVGHTPQQTCNTHLFKNGDGSKNFILFCDTHSLYRDGTNIGDNTMLEMDVEKQSILPVSL